MDDFLVNDVIPEDEFYKFLSTVFVLSSVEVIVKGHLLIERELAKLIEHHLLEPNEAKNINKKFISKLELATALGALSKEERNALSKFNNIRNSIAHNIDFKITDKEYEDQWSTLLPRHKEMYNTIVNQFKARNHIINDPLSKMHIVIMILWLDIIIISRLEFPHKKKLEKLNYYYEHVISEKRRWIDELNVQKVVLNKEIELLEIQTKQVKQDAITIKEETEIIRKEIKLKKETISYLKKKVSFLENS